MTKNAWQQEKSWERSMGPLNLCVSDGGPPDPELLSLLSPDALNGMAAKQFYWYVRAENAELSGNASSKEQAMRDCEAAALDMLPDGFTEGGS